MLENNCFSKNGRLTISPKKEYKETHGKDQIYIALYQTPNGFLYSFNIRLGAFIRSSYPHPQSRTYPTITQAQQSAHDAMYSAIRENPAAKKRYKQFSVPDYRQQEFSFEYE